MAQYYKKKKGVFSVDFFESISKKNKVIVLPRDRSQYEDLIDKRMKNVIICRDVLSLRDIYSNCLLFIGAGGTMTRELAVLGVTTISVYQDKLLEVDKYLIDSGMMHYSQDLSSSYVNKVLKEMTNKNNTQLLSKGGIAFEIIRKEIQVYDKCD